MPPMPPGGIAGPAFSFSGTSVTNASVVSNRPAIDAAFCNALRVTLVGSTMPAFRGAAAVRDALAAGHGWIGATVHVVTPLTDRGPVITRRPLRVELGEDENAAMRRLHPLEHELVAAAVLRRLYERE